MNVMSLKNITAGPKDFVSCTELKHAVKTCVFVLRLRLIQYYINNSTITDIKTQRLEAYKKIMYNLGCVPVSILLSNGFPKVTAVEDNTASVAALWLKGVRLVNQFNCIQTTVQPHFSSFHSSSSEI